MKSSINSPYNDYNTNFCNADIGTAAKLILDVSNECSKRSADKLLRFLWFMRLTSTEFNDHVYSPQDCRKVLRYGISKTASLMLLGSANSGKEEQKILYMRDPLEATRAQTRHARKDQVFTMCDYGI